MKVFDFHTHIFPDDLALHALDRLAYSSAIIPHSDGTLNGTKEIMRNAGIYDFLTLHIATNVKQQTNVNNFAISVDKSKQAHAFGSVHPSSDTALDELERLYENGIKGIKLHPDYQNFFLADKKLYPIYDFCKNKGMIVLFHAGHDPAFAGELKAGVQSIKTVAKDFNGLQFVAAHFGGLLIPHEVESEIAGIVDIYLDTSCSVGFVSPELAAKIILKHGSDKILFGSDCPWGSPKAHFDFIDSLKISSKDKELIFCKNAERLLKLN